MTDQKKIERQIDLEEEMVCLGADQVRKRIEKARQEGREGGTGYGKNLLAGGVEKVAEGVTAFLDEANSGKPGPRHKAVKYIKDIEPEVVAFIALRCIVDGVTNDRFIQKVALQIGSGIEAESRFRYFQEADKELYQRMERRTKTATSERVRSKTFGAVYAKEGIAWEGWTQVDVMHIGMKLIDIVIETTGYVHQTHKFVTSHNTPVILRATEETLEWISGRSARSEFMAPMWFPMITPPQDWTAPEQGGYLSKRVPQLRLVKTFRKGYIEELENRVEEMADVYQAVNGLQATAWRINSSVLTVLDHLWEIGHPVGKLPGRSDIPLPPKPHDIETNEENRKEWRKAAAAVHEKNKRSRSKRLQAGKCLWMAGRFKDEEEIYFPYQLDFRGRIYAVPNYLNPQGADFAKGLIEFANAKPINDGVAAGWLAVHGSNLAGFDKASLEDRISWIEDRNDIIMKIAEDPLGTLDLPLDVNDNGDELTWAGMKKAFQFLAFCFEWAGFLKEGYGYMSRIAVAMDGSNNGLQNFAAMLRDPISGEAVNLVPKDLPEDIYGKVAEVVTGKVRLDLSTLASDDPKREYAQGWLDIGINRELCKRPVMVLPYGGTLYSCREYVEKHLEEQIANGTETLWENHKTSGALTYMARYIWDSIGEVVVAARAAMDWLQEAAKFASAEGLPINWTVPTGLPILQAYPEVKNRRVKTRLGDSIIFISLKEDVDKVDRRKQRNGISPNFVHSMDAAHLVKSVCLALDNGVSDFAMVHDSYGTHAADTEMLAQCLRRAFVDLYSEQDVLENFRDEIVKLIGPKKAKKLSPVPPKGNLDLAAVQESVFFFA